MSYSQWGCKESGMTVYTYTYRVMQHQCCSHVATTAQAKSLQVLVALLVLSLDTFPTFLQKTVQELMSF